MDSKLNASEEVDLYAGIKPKVGAVTFDLGFITYNYLGKNVNHLPASTIRSIWN